MKLINLQLIVSENGTTGQGKTNEDPIRTLFQLYTTDGRLVFQYDPHLEKTTMGEHLVATVRKITPVPVIGLDTK